MSLQIFVGVSMVICGALALRYQSYLFYYGSGLWAGTVAGIAGILGVTATKEGLVKPKWLCGGRKWQIHIFLAAVMVALSSAIVAAIFSTSGLVRDTQYDYSKVSVVMTITTLVPMLMYAYKLMYIFYDSKDVSDMTPDEETFEKRKSSGIMINAILLLLSLLQILLSFCSFGIALRVLCSKPNGRALLSPGSADGASEITMRREILGVGPEYYEARKDRLLRWLGHQGRTFTNHTPHGRSVLAKNIANSIYSHKMAEKRLYPRFVALQQSPSANYMQSSPAHHQQPIPFVIPAPISAPLQRSIIIPPGPLSLPAPVPPPYHHHHHPHYPQSLIVPIIPLPVRQPRSVTPVSVANSYERRNGGIVKGHRRRRGYTSSALSSSSVGGRSKRSNASSTVFPSRRRREIIEREQAAAEAAIDNQEKDVEITEEELSKTYTGLDRAVAEEFISNTMNPSSN